MTNANDNTVLGILDAYKAAVYAKDVDAFVALYDEDVLVFDMWGMVWLYQGINSWRAMAESWFDSLGTDRVVVDMDDLKLRQTTQMAVASAFVKYTAVSAEGATLRSLQNRLTMVLEPRGGVWKIIHEHTSAPVDGNTLKVTLQR